MQSVSGSSPTAPRPGFTEYRHDPAEVVEEAIETAADGASVIVELEYEEAALTTALTSNVVKIMKSISDSCP
jgi:hypothetical protein